MISLLAELVEFLLRVLSVIVCLIVSMLQLLRVMPELVLKLMEPWNEDLVDSVALLLVLLLHPLMLFTERSNHLLVFFVQFLQLFVHLVKKVGDLVELFFERACVNV